MIYVILEISIGNHNIMLLKTKKKIPTALIFTQIKHYKLSYNKTHNIGDNKLTCIPYI